VIAEIAVVGGERIDTAQVRMLSLLRVGERWTPTVRDRALSALRSLPAVRDVRLVPERLGWKRIRVRVEVQEREPFGLISYEGKVYWVDPEGYLLGEASPSPPPPGFPVVEGVALESTPEGERVTPERARRALRAFFASEGQILARIRALRVRPFDGELELRVPPGRRVLLPLRDLRQTLATLERTLAALAETSLSDWHVLDLRVEGEVTVRR